MTFFFYFLFFSIYSLMPIQEVKRWIFLLQFFIGHFSTLFLSDLNLHQIIHIYFGSCSHDLFFFVSINLYRYTFFFLKLDLSVFLASFILERRFWEVMWRKWINEPNIFSFSDYRIYLADSLNISLFRFWRWNSRIISALMFFFLVLFHCLLFCLHGSVRFV